KPARAIDRPAGDEAPVVDAHFMRDNVEAQRHVGYSTVTINLPLGDLTPTQGRGIASIARRYCGDDFRTTVEQNILLRWVSDADLPALYAELARLGLQEAGAGGLTDVTSCPGTDTCKLGISSSRGLAKELKRSLTLQQSSLPESVHGLHIKCSGC